MKYTVKNVYGIRGETNHRILKAAVKACNKREGEGWIVWDNEKNQQAEYDYYQMMYEL